jgi:hypothetical protein
LSTSSALDERGIDTILGETAKFPSDQRPRLAPLAGFTVEKADFTASNSTVGKTDFSSDRTWAHAFEEGAAGALFAVKRGSGESIVEQATARCASEKDAADIRACEFVAQWRNAGKERRIFVAFTRSDFEIAERVKDALEKEGYLVFLYLQGRSEAPWAEPGLVGAIFVQAGHRLVIDTKHSRGSEGVAIEQKYCQDFLWSYPSPPTRWVTALRAQQ